MHQEGFCLVTYPFNQIKKIKFPWPQIGRVLLGWAVAEEAGLGIGRWGFHVVSKYPGSTSGQLPSPEQPPVQINDNNICHQ